MNRTRFWAGVIACFASLISVSLSFAAAPAIASAETGLAVGLTGSYVHYQENLGPLSDSESGGLAGFSARLSRLGTVYGVSDVYAALNYQFSGGMIGYDGFTQPGQPYHTADRAFFNQVEVRLGQGFTIANGAEVIPFISGGFQNWYRNIGGASGLGEYYQAGEAGVGIKFDLVASPLLVLSASAEGTALFGGSVSAPALQFNGNFGTSGEQRVSLGADYRVGGQWHLFAGLGVTHFNYSGSKADNGFFEPESSTVVVRSELGVAFGF